MLAVKKSHTLTKSMCWATGDNEQIHKSHNVLMNNLQTDKELNLFTVWITLFLVKNSGALQKNLNQLVRPV